MPTDQHYQVAMRRALELAALGQGRTGANPIVGSVIIDADGEIISEGFHAGGDHAEVVALKKCGEIPADATIVVTLEPCNHTGKTGPCTEAIIQSGINRVVFAVNDPNPVAANGRARLAAAGIQVVSGVLVDEARFVNRAWLQVIEKRRPLFIWKIAATLDGKSAASDGTSKWITSEGTRQYVTQLRRASDAILVGTGTVLADDPELLPHDSIAAKNPVRVIAGERAIPANAKIMDDRAETLIYPSRELAGLSEQLLQRNIKQVLVEAGSGLGTALFNAGLIDEIILIQAPTLFGIGRAFIGDIGITTIAERKDLQIISNTMVGADLVTHLKVGK